jgi:5-methylcytosine-specific restriction endonuclease McrA
MAGIKKTKRKELGTMKWKNLRLRILDRDDRICAYCGTEGADTVDHRISRADGGDVWDMDNLVTACKSCNSAKGKRSFFYLNRSTPPVFANSSLPETHVTVHASPFQSGISPSQ